jgi:hypothetical protein
VEHAVGKPAHLGVAALAGVAAHGVGQPTTSCRVSRAEPSRGSAQELQRATPSPTKPTSPDSQNGQRMWCALDALTDGTLIAVSFVGCGSLPEYPLASCGSVLLERVIASFMWQAFARSVSGRLPPAGV